MPKPKRTVLIIENQKFQQDEFFDCLKDYYEVYPNDDDYVSFIDNVRVWVNEEYKDDYRENALNYVTQVINNKDLNIELILMDHKLGGAHKCKTGIDLAAILNEPRKTTNSILPIIFISKTEHTDKKRISEFDDYQSKYPNTSTWVHKGYFGDEILEPEFLKKNVISEIDKLLGQSSVILSKDYCENTMLAFFQSLLKQEELAYSSYQRSNKLASITLLKSLIEGIKLFVVNKKIISNDHKEKYSALVSITELAKFDDQEWRSACEELTAQINL
jgi:hypothetical protein